MITATVPGTQLPEPLAVDAATASTAAGPCRLCRRAILRGERYARLVPSGRLAHLACIAQTTARNPR